MTEYIKLHSIIMRMLNVAQVTPKCHIDYRTGEQLNLHGISSKSFDVTYEARDNLTSPQDNGKLKKYPLEAEFSMGINVVNREEVIYFS